MSASSEDWNQFLNKYRDCCDLIFPVLPGLAIYLLGSVGEEDESVASQELVNISVGTECAIDVHLRNAMILNSYPEMLYFSSLRATTLTLSAYDEFRWIQEHQDYSRLKQRCRQKFLQVGVTKTLVIKGTIALFDLTDEVTLDGESPVGFGSFSDVWKGTWRDKVEQREKLVSNDEIHFQLHLLSVSTGRREISAKRDRKSVV